MVTVVLRYVVMTAMAMIPMLIAVYVVMWPEMGLDWSSVIMARLAIAGSGGNRMIIASVLPVIFLVTVDHML